MPKARPTKKVSSPKKASKKAPSISAASKKTLKKTLPAFTSLTPAQLIEMTARIQSDPRRLALLGFLNTFMQASEYQIIQMMVHNRVWSGNVPPNPGGSGQLEFGLFDYWLNNPTSKAALELQRIWKSLVRSLPVTQISAANYQNLLNAVTPPQPGLVASDGTLYNTTLYAQMDPHWTIAVLEYFKHLENYSHPFPQNLKAVPLKGASSSQVTIAMMGDWGTGPYPNGPAADVMNGIQAQKPDYIVHLGDVYYAGSPGEEQGNLLSNWPAAYAGKSFTLNSNHEMYYGALGYFGTALTSKIFSAQNNASYFALQYGNPNQTGGPWTIVGLDSAYWSPSIMVMEGSIQGIAGSGALAQPQFLQGLVKSGVSPKNTIVLTHHNPISYDGANLITDLFGNNLYNQVTGALGGPPTGWYWGHVHNGIVYPNPTAQGAFKGYGRCAGHGAIPFGNAWGLAAAPASQVKCYANTSNSAVPLRVMNGFVLLTITTSGQVTETFYDQTGKPSAWVQPFTYQLG